MKTIRYTSTLFYYDGPQVFEARDSIGGHYIGLMVEPECELDRFLVKGVAPETLRRFRSGLIDLRTLLVGDDGDWYLATAPQGLDHPLELTAQDGSLADSGLLPDPGFLLHVHAGKSSDLRTLNPNQREAVEWNDGPLLVLAGPGSGKTRVLTLRAARLLEERPDISVLALTFTTKAADEMRERLEALLGGRTERAQLCTYHSFAGDILRQFGSKLGVRPDFALLTTEEDRIAFLEGLLSPKGDTPPPSYAEDVPGDRRNVLDLLDSLFDESYDGGSMVPSLPHPPWWVAPLFNDYCGMLVAANRFDFGALLHMAKRVLAEVPHTAKMLRYGWTHLCVDEFQDTNRAQYDLLHLLVAAGERNLFVVADDDQIIYQWNGASPERLLALQRDFGMARVQLPSNYRCPPEIIELANELIAHNSTRTPDKSALVADRMSGEENPIDVIDFDDEFEEASGIANLIVDRGLDPADCVVLARNAKILKEIAKALEEAGIKAWLTQRKNEFESAPASWFHSILRLANSRHDREFVRRACVAWKGMGNPLIEVPVVEAEAALHGGDFLRAWLALAEGKPADSLLDVVFNNLAERTLFLESISAFWQHYEKDEDPLIAEEISVWKEVDHSIRGRIGVNDLTLNHYLQEMDMLSKAAPQPEGAIPCITVHGAKGGEFKHVFLAGMAEEVFPSFQAVRKGPSSPEMEEERRSCFVAVTRVQKTLTITWARSYSGYSKRPSRFLGEMNLL
jgi:DNA helicase-2/ATP-dependent DNA helicase PcrA